MKEKCQSFSKIKRAASQRSSHPNAAHLLLPQTLKKDN